MLRNSIIHCFELELRDTNTVRITEPDVAELGTFPYEGCRARQFTDNCSVLQIDHPQPSVILKQLEMSPAWPRAQRHANKKILRILFRSTHRRFSEAMKGLGPACRVAAPITRNPLLQHLNDSAGIS